MTVDYYSDFWEVDYLADTGAQTIIGKLKAHCARHGIPDTIVSDNGPQYSCHAFARFCESWDITHMTSSPYNSKANGKAESAVKTCKQIMRKCIDSGSDPLLAILDHRNTPSQGLLSSRAQRLMSRRTKTLLPTVTALLRPQVVDAQHTSRDIKVDKTDRLCTTTEAHPTNRPWKKVIQSDYSHSNWAARTGRKVPSSNDSTNARMS